MIMLLNHYKCRYIYFLGLLCILFPILSCNKDLNIAPQTILTDAGFWKTTDDLETACNYLYTQLPAPGSGTFYDNMSEITCGATTNSISDGSRTPPATDANWSNNYALIRACNTILENAPEVTGTPALISQYMGEASFFRAYAYFALIERFGDVPLIMRTFDVNDTLAVAHRTPESIVVDSIYADLDNAAAELPDAASQGSANYGRVTQGAAMALKSRVALFMGTWEKFHGGGNASNDLQLAVSAAQTVMSSGEYGLFTYSAVPDSSYFYLFQDAGNGAADKENILAVLYGQNAQNDISGNDISAYIGQALITPTRALTDSYLFKDGLPLGQSSLQIPLTNTLSEFQNRDPRMGMTVFNKNMWYTSSWYAPSFQYTLTGYKFAKYFNSNDWLLGVGFNDFTILRYAEVLLNYAEAKFELNGSISDADLSLSINLIRSRVNMPALTNAFVAANGLSMEQEIRRERTVELAMEGIHYFDILRWKTAETVLPAAMLGDKYFPAEQGVIQNVVLATDSTVVAELASKRSFNPARDYLWPIPTNELGLDPNLTQNPNW